MQNFVAFLLPVPLIEFRSMSRINQQEIAEMLQLSQTTVSRSLANHPAINAETKAMVLEAAAKLGYSQRIKRTQQSAAAQRTAIWGILITMPRQHSGPAEIFQQALRGIADKSSAQDSVLDVVYHDPGDSSPQKLLKRIRATGWKGAILIYPIAPALAHEIANQVACVSIIENYQHDLIDSVDVDQSEAIFSLVRMLHEQGHRRIGFTSWVYSVEAPWVTHRFGSFVESLYRLGMEFSPQNVVNLKQGEQLEPPDIARIWTDKVRRGDVSAIVCAADHQAYPLVEAFRAAGIRVPEDVSVTGFDGIIPPPGQKQLATVKVPYEELGRSATHQLIRRIEQPTAPRRHILVDGIIEAGETVKAPRQVTTTAV